MGRRVHRQSGALRCRARRQHACARLVHRRADGAGLGSGGPGRTTNVKPVIECGLGQRSPCCGDGALRIDGDLEIWPRCGRFALEAWTVSAPTPAADHCVVRVEPPAGPKRSSACSATAPRKPGLVAAVSVPGQQPCDEMLREESTVPPPARCCFPRESLSCSMRLDTGVWHAPCVGKIPRCALFVDAPTEVSVGPPPPPDPPPPPRPRGELQVTVSGGGLVLGADAGIVCGWSPRTRNDCSYDFETHFTSTRHLQAVATRRVQFVRWGGLCHGKSRTCTVQMTNNRRKDLSTFAVTALFRRR